MLVIQARTWHHAADPAAEEFKYPVSIDVRDLVTLDDVMEEMQLGPNGCGATDALHHSAQLLHNSARSCTTSPSLLAHATWLQTASGLCRQAGQPVRLM
jgi:hypothetical protein